MELLPVNRDEHPIKPDESRRFPLVGPSVTSPMQVDLFELAVIQEAPESAHHPAVEVPVILILIPIDQVEVSAEGPRTGMPPADISQLSQKGDLVSLSLWTVYTGKPPPSTTTHRGDPGRDTVTAIMGAIELHHPAIPCHKDPPPLVSDAGKQK
jgi:hypothetical protein